ncbi:MAG: ABC transporter substrate-binding protein [Alphaproteobacteria bacterium]|nr:ABC transporter substrate-binding protein [Alphaproteobacteria bacterium]
MGLHIRRLILAGSAVVLLAGGAGAKTFRWANDGDSNSMDPYARQETFLLLFDQSFYEQLVRWDKDMKLEGALATEWSQTDPTTWRFKLRQGVKFHDGTPFTADDVVFSYDRATHPGSNVASPLATVKEVKKIDDYTVDFITDGPDPIMPNNLPTISIMSKKWCEEHNTTRAADLTKNEESYATRNENGTGPFILADRQPDVKTMLKKNPDWWGLKQWPIDFDDTVFNRIENASTRVSALLSGELDFLYTVPPQDTDRIEKTPGMKIWKTPELRTIFLGMDQSRDELLESNIKGKNPFKDKRVREAFTKAIDEDAIAAKVMRGYAHPTALMIGPGVNGYDPALDKRFPVDIAGAKKLLADAGYPDGFEVGFDCPNDRYVNDEAVCQAVVAMLARIGIKANLLAQTRAKYFGKINAPKYDTSFYLLGWTPGTQDALDTIKALVMTRRDKNGVFNIGGYSNPKLDDLAGQIQVELNQDKRNTLIAQALTMIKDDYAYIPLHQQIVVWASRDNVTVAPMGNNTFQLRYVTMK